MRKKWLSDQSIEPPTYRLYNPDDVEDIGLLCFNEGSWDIIEYKPQHWNSVISHNCIDKKFKCLMVIRRYCHPICTQCNEPMPSNIQTIWKLMNFDELQRGN